MGAKAKNPRIGPVRSLEDGALAGAAAERMHLVVGCGEGGQVVGAENLR
jgi:hypothetical protein